MSAKDPTIPLPQNLNDPPSAASMQVSKFQQFE